MKVSVIIPALNEEELIERAARSAWAATADEVIVVDGGSRDRTVAVARQHGCRLLDSCPGRAWQQNLGAKQAAGDVLLFLHADNRLGSEAIRQIRTLLEASDRWGGAFQQRIEAEGWAFRLLERGNAWRVRRQGLPYGDQGIFIRRELFLELGGFPELPLMEDLVFMQKLRRRSWPALLPGPIYVSARRWQRHGVVGQTARNWMLLTAHRLGVPPQRLAARYRRHDQ